MTTRLYIGDPYRASFTATVLDTADEGLVLDQSCFFGPSGLLPDDSGWIGSQRVVGLRRRPTGALLHVVDPCSSPDQAPPGIGERVRCGIDWNDRRRSMTLHTAQHLVELGAGATNQLVAAERPPVGRDEASVELVFETPSIDAGAIVDWFAEVVGDDLSMGTVAAPPPLGGRLWSLDGHGHCHCDAPHLRTTGELSQVEVEPVAVGHDRLRVDLRTLPDSAHT